MKKSQTLKINAIGITLLLSAPIVNIGFRANASIRVDELDTLFQTTIAPILIKKNCKKSC